MTEAKNIVEDLESKKKTMVFQVLNITDNFDQDLKSLVQKKVNNTVHNSLLLKCNPWSSVFQLVVSICLFSFCFMPILYCGVNYDQPSNYIYHHPSPPHTISLISSAQIPFSYTLTQSSFISHIHIYKLCSPLLFAIKKHDSFHTVTLLKWLTMSEDRLKCIFAQRLSFAQRERVQF